MDDVPLTVAGYHVYRYEHVDELSFVRSAKQVDRTSPFAGNLKTLEPDIAVLFRANGWEGDGNIGIVWVPPFVGSWGSRGLLVWFVKQFNNGTSFIASEQPLPFADLWNDDNDDEDAGAGRFDGLIPEGLLRGPREGLEGQVQHVMSNLEEDIAAIAILPPSSRVAAHLTERAQGQMIQVLMAFLDDCYLRILIEVVRDGNKSSVKLRKSKTSINLGSYLPDEFEGDERGFFTLNGFISDLWASYKFEPFAVKVEMLLKPIDLVIDATLMSELRKHVLLRNSVQHHEGWVSSDLLRGLGRSYVPIAGPTGPERMSARSRIVFPVDEIRAFDRVLRTFAQSVDTHVERRIATRMYAPPSRAGGALA